MIRLKDCLKYFFRKVELEAKDSKEVAKKLIKTGAIDSIKKSVAERAKAEKSTGFKRSQGLERKLTGMTDNARAGYQPFTVIFLSFYDVEILT